MDVPCVSDKESSNVVYLLKNEMQKSMKGKASGSANRERAGVDFSIYSGQPKNTTRNPKWPEDHNVVLGDLLLEQYVNGNFCNGNLRKEQWGSLVATLNRRLRSNYIESSVMIRFKNMKADFRTLYQLTNRSGWGWDEELHIPVATDELWDEISQVNPKLTRFRRHPFHQYEIFEKICAENIATGNGAKCSQVTEPTVNLQEDVNPQYEDDFLTTNGVSYNFKGIDNSTLPDAVEEEPPYVGMESSPTLGSKRTIEKPTKSSRCPKKKSGLQNLNQLLVESNKNTMVFKDTIQRSDPYTMTDCLNKLGQIENLTTQALLAVQDALKENKDNKAILMTWEGTVLADWIEYVVSMHPRFHSAKVWE